MQLDIEEIQRLAVETDKAVLARVSKRLAEIYIEFSNTDPEIIIPNGAEWFWSSLDGELMGEVQKLLQEDF